MLQLKDLPDTKILAKFAQRYPDANIDHTINFLTLLRVGSDLSSQLDNYLAQHGLLQGRWWVLILLMRQQNLISSPSELAEKAGVSRATMTGLINGLDKDGFVNKISVDDDKRKLQIKLSPSGQNKLDQLMPGYYQRVDALMSALSALEGQQLKSMLINLQNHSDVFD